MKEQTCAPDPSLLESMRSVGYDLNTAVADIIDNSIAANAHRVSVRYFDQGEAPYIAIVDDGDGMDLDTALAAMRLAGKSPLEQRDANDLGRFGLGLKTASFSQARSLLVRSISHGTGTTLCWDLDRVASTGRWSLEQLNEDETIAAIPAKVHASMPLNHGTCVLWRNLDKLETLTGSALRDVDRAMSEMAEYLALVFHRFTHPYLSDDIDKVTIDINGYELPRRDPFLADNPAVQITSVQRIGDSGATLRGYTLPYQNRLSDNDRKLLSLSEERGKTLTDTQGFYIYRAYRLITWGSWFRMLPKKQATKLSRVRVDIPNTLDAEWTLDIKKSKAAPPRIVSEVMKRYTQQLAKPSRRVQQFRGRKKSELPEAPIWDVIDDRDGAFRYEINQDNPYIASFMNDLTADQQKVFGELARALAYAIPYDDMESRFARDQRSTDAELTDTEARTFAQQMWALNSVAHFSPCQFVDRFKNVEPISLCSNGESILKEVAHVR